jgi:hypothetical protein
MDIAAIDVNVGRIFFLSTGNFKLMPEHLDEIVCRHAILYIFMFLHNT